MTHDSFSKLLLDSDLRTLRRNRIVVEKVKDQESFDELFALVFHQEHTLVLRAIKAVEEITLKHPELLLVHKNQLVGALKSAGHKELKWHIAQLITRIELSAIEVTEVRHVLLYWALNRNESKIVRVNALQGLFDLSQKYVDVKPDLLTAIAAMEHEVIPSIKARLKRLKKLL